MRHAVGLGLLLGALALPAGAATLQGLSATGQRYVVNSDGTVTASDLTPTTALIGAGTEFTWPSGFGTLEFDFRDDHLMMFFIAPSNATSAFSQIPDFNGFRFVLDGPGFAGLDDAFRSGLTTGVLGTPPEASLEGPNILRISVGGLEISGSSIPDSPTHVRFTLTLAEPPPAVIPLPPALALLLGALGCLGLMARRRRA